MDENLFILLGLGVVGFWLWSKQARTPPPGIEAPPNTPNTPVPVVTSGDMSKPRGIRNNNPGNIKWSAANNWLGQVGKDSGGFVVFDTPAHGLRAMAKLLKTYYNTHGLHTLLDITKRWSPDAVGLSGNYAFTVSKYIGIAPSSPLSMVTQLQPVMSGMIAMENGAAYLNYFTPAAINAAIAAS